MTPEDLPRTQPAGGYQPATWRLLITPPADGSWNMAVDEALLERVYNQQSPPVLRLYAWAPPCLSLGYAQTIKDVNLGQLHERGWQLVRRPTGGKAILHTDELTYSVIAPTDEPRLKGGVLESYLRLSTAILAALRRLQLPVQAQELSPGSQASSDSGPVCFEVPSNYEITLNGKKLVGSAQARKKEGILQHGTLPLYGDLTRITEVLNFTDPAQRQSAAERLLERATTVEMALGKTLAFNTAAAAFVQGFRETLQLEFESIPLTSAEEGLAAQLAASKYSHPDWTGRV